MLVQLHLLDKGRRHLNIAVKWRQKSKYNLAYSGLVERVKKSSWLVYGRIACHRSLFAETHRPIATRVVKISGTSAGRSLPKDDCIVISEKKELQRLTTG